jgi:hypothetical protein
VLNTFVYLTRGSSPMQSFSEFLNESKSGLRARIMSKVEKQSNGCWIFKGHKGTDLYGQIFTGGQAQPVHRVLYQMSRGAIPSGQVLMHDKGCSRSCCNPAHMTVGSKDDNNEQTARDGRSRNQHTKSRTASGTPKDIGTRPHGQ